MTTATTKRSQRRPRRLYAAAAGLSLTLTAWLNAGAAMAARVDSSLLSYWPIDEGGGDTVKDKNGTIDIKLESSCAKAWQWDVVTQAINFVGEHAMSPVCAGTATTAGADAIYKNIQTQDQFTAEVWFNPANIKEKVNIFSYGNSLFSSITDLSNFFIQQNGNDVEFGVRNDLTADRSPSPHRLRVAHILVVNRPTQVVLRWQGKGISPKVQLDVNVEGEQPQTVQTDLPIGSTLNNWESNYIYLSQKRYTQVSKFGPQTPETNFKGHIYLAAIYNRALTQPEVTQNREAGHLPCVDKDGDGYGNPGNSECQSRSPLLDCDDTPVTGLKINPGATETCNNIDDDCDTATVDGAGETNWGLACDGADSDKCNEGTYNSCSGTTLVCSDTTGNALDLCNGVNNTTTEDCNTATVDGAGETNWNQTCDDADSDLCQEGTWVCPGAAGLTCNDNDAENDLDLCGDGDQDCDAASNDGTEEPTWYQACDFTDTVAPIDTDLDTCQDDRKNACSVTTLICGDVDTDVDNDGYSACGGNCTQPAYSCDCNDTPGAGANIHPGATEVCNGVDDDCDWPVEVDEGASGGSTYYRDDDNDGHGEPVVTITACSLPSGYVTVNDDCADNDPARYPGNAEICDGKDNDCDGTPDDNAGNTWYRDADADGQGTAATSQRACTQPGGYVSNSTDCEDNPAACGANCKVGGTEVCDGYNNDCDAQTDEGVGTTWYSDADGDGFGTTATVQPGCTQPIGYVNNASDCNDTPGAGTAIHPDAADRCNATDDDCNPATPNGYGEAWFGVPCTSGGSGVCAVGIYDCPANAQICRPFGGLEEQCDNKDNDCDGVVDNIDKPGGCSYPLGCELPVCFDPPASCQWMCPLP